MTLNVECKYKNCKHFMKEIGTVLEGDIFKTVYICTNPKCDNCVILHTENMIK